MDVALSHFFSVFGMGKWRESILFNIVKIVLPLFEDSREVVR